MTDLYAREPDSAVQLLRSGGASCDTGTPPEALKACSPQHWCTWPTGGEVCVRALEQAATVAPAAPIVAGPVALVSGLGIMLIGVAIGWMLRRP